MTTSPTCRQDAAKLCDPGCSGETSGVCGASGLTTLAHARERFLQEAIVGTCNTGRYQCAYWSWGSGPPIVFIHGLSDRAASFLVPASLLTQQFRCIAYELPEGGADKAKLRLYSHADLVADTGALLDHLQIERAYLYGSSFGSTIALEALRQQPRRYPRAILQGGFARRPLHLLERLLASSLRFWPGRMRHLPLRRQLLCAHRIGPLTQRSDLWEHFMDCAGTQGAWEGG